MAQLICRDLCLGYDGNILLNNLNFSVNAGDYLCIVGENGTGKTTLMKTILHLQKPLSGEIKTSDGVLASQIGYLPQQTAIQRDFPASVKEIVLSGFQAKPDYFFWYSSRQKKEAMANIERMGITQLADKCYRNLSGGQQQRVLLARALCATKKMLLLDEPVTGLDPIATNEMYALIDSLNKSGISIIMISHDINFAVEHASHILHIGKHVFFGTKDEYCSSEIGKMYLNLEAAQ
ncbi:MAG: ABC transporter ATP-binding protein [Treponema sp.]|nr:ABC transporter ATP-binding protein [Treponema sp.]